MTTQELASYLRVKESWVRYQIFKKNIPYIKIGRLIRFDQKLVDAWVAHGNAEASRG